jgi:hypothetical protein
MGQGAWFSTEMSTRYVCVYAYRPVGIIRNYHIFSLPVSALKTSRLQVILQHSLLYVLRIEGLFRYTQLYIYLSFLFRRITLYTYSVECGNAEFQWEVICCFILKTGSEFISLHAVSTTHTVPYRCVQTPVITWVKRHISLRANYLGMFAVVLIYIAIYFISDFSLIFPVYGSSWVHILIRRNKPSFFCRKLRSL